LVYSKEICWVHSHIPEGEGVEGEESRRVIVEKGE